MGGAGPGPGLAGSLRSAYQLCRLVHPIPQPLNSHHGFLLLNTSKSFGSVGSDLLYLHGQKPLFTEEKSMCASLEFQISCVGLCVLSASV